MAEALWPLVDLTDGWRTLILEIVAMIFYIVDMVFIDVLASVLVQFYGCAFIYVLYNFLFVTVGL